MMKMGEHGKRVNHDPLTPLSFLQRAAQVHPNRTSIIFNNLRFTWSDTYTRCVQLASSLNKLGIGPGDVVAVLAPNVPAVYESHFGVPMCGATLNAINFRLDARTVSNILLHSSSKAILVDHQFVSLIRDALLMAQSSVHNGVLFTKIPVIVIGGDEEDDVANPGGEKSFQMTDLDYEEFLSQGDPKFEWIRPDNENKEIALNYTSGTTSFPKGVVYTHRGACLTAIGNAMEWQMPKGCVYLWTLPMFHCNGWCFPWAVAAVFGTNVCLRQVTARSIFRSIEKHRVTHFCGAPVVLNFIVNANPDERQSYLSHRASAEGSHVVHVMTAGAAPPPSILSRMEDLGFRTTHTYGLTETYGPCTICEWKDEEWAGLSPEHSSQIKSRQGVGYLTLGDLEVMNSNTMDPVPCDGMTIGEVMMRGNMVMKTYFNNTKATHDAFHNGWFHSGDLAVKHPDGYIEVKDRSKDIIISGGENISSIAVESVLYRHAAVFEAAVVAMPDEVWGEVVCAFVTLKDGCAAKEDDIILHCRQNLPRFMVPRVVVFQPLPKTATGKIQKYMLRKQAELCAIGSKRKSKL